MNLLPKTQASRAAPPRSADEIFAEIDKACRMKWQADYKMIVYCKNKQTEALRTVMADYQAAPDDEDRQIMLRCMDKWQKGKSTDWSMVKYCHKKQSEARRVLRGN